MITKWQLQKGGLHLLSLLILVEMLTRVSPYTSRFSHSLHVSGLVIYLHACTLAQALHKIKYKCALHLFMWAYQVSLLMQDAADSAVSLCGGLPPFGFSLFKQRMSACTDTAIVSLGR